jgi:hypothetical protein
MAKAGFVVLVATEVFSLLISLTMVISPFTVLNRPEFRLGEGELLSRGWGITWLALSVVILVLLFTAFRRGSRWAWLVITVVPLLWLAHFMLAPETVHNLVLALVTAVALGVTYPWLARGRATVEDTEHS